MAAMLETPSRVWRRIEAIEDQDMPSLPSLPDFEDSDAEPLTSRVLPQDSDEQTDDDDDHRRFQSTKLSTPTNSQYTPTIRALSTGTTARFVDSLGSRRTFTDSRSRHVSPAVARFPSLPKINVSGDAPDLSISDHPEEESKSSVPDVYLPPPDDDDLEEKHEDVSLTDALQSLSFTGSPSNKSAGGGTPGRKYDYSTSLKSDAKSSPFDKFQNVGIRNKGAARIRTPSLTRTISSQSSSPTNSTPPSTRSTPLSRFQATSPMHATRLPLPRSATTSPAIRAEPSVESTQSEHNRSNTSRSRSMEIENADIPSQLDSTQEEKFSHGEDESEDDPESSSTKGHEPTFSSDGAPTPFSNKHDSFASPNGSLGFTPTPAFPRPRARFNLPSPDDEILSTPAQTSNEEQGYTDLITPHTRRRSFLLSVINSTARPRLKMGTPHPKALPTPSIAESTPGPIQDESTIKGINLRNAFAGVTPRANIPINRRMSHPLAQTYVPSPTPSDTDSIAGYDGMNDRISVISTTSSNDLTAHPRANASFDPTMGFGMGATAHGIGRFNAGKLNNYLHTLNRRLQEENEVLLDKLRRLQEEQHEEESAAALESNRRLSAGSAGNRRLSTGTVLGNVEEDPAAERWLEEKAEMEEMVEGFKEEAEKYMAEKEEVENALETMKRERERDKERWKERMAEVEEGVAGLVSQLERKLEATEKKAEETELASKGQLNQLKKEIDDLRAERDLANERVDKAQEALESDKDLGGALNEVNERLAEVMNNLRNANGRIKDLEKDLKGADTRIDELETQHNKDQQVITELEEDVNAAADELETERAKVEELETHIQLSEKEYKETKEYINELEENAEVIAERLESLESEMVDAENTIKKLEVSESEARKQVSQLEEESAKIQDVNSGMEEALKEAEEKMFEDGEAIMKLRSELAALEREKQRILATSPSAAPSTNLNDSTEAELEALEVELDDAHREIARLTALLEQSPARKAMEMAKDARIEMLEKEREELLQRNKSLRMTVNEVTTPNKLINNSGISPIHRHVLSMSIRMPKTPGGPLRELSWLNNTINDPTVAPLLAEINRLQQELDHANESIDDKIDKLEDAGLGVVELTQRLADARAKCVALEDEVNRLKRTEDRRSQRLQRIRCQKCKVKVDVRQILYDEESFLDTSRDALPSEPPTPPTRTTETLRQNLKEVSEELTNLKQRWQEEKRKLVNEKAVLEDATSRLNEQVREDTRRINIKRNGDKKREDVETELRRTIQELEEELRSERSRLRNLDTQQGRMQRDRDELLNQLKRTESDMEDVREQLQKFKQENNQLEKELRQNTTVEHKAKLLEKKVSENHKTIETLRQERASLSNDFKDLQKRYTQASERANHLREEYAASSNVHEHRRQQLDNHLLEIEDLKRALANQNTKVQQVEEEKERILAERNDVAKTIAMLEAELRRVRKDAETFRRDLKSLRTEKEKAEVKYKDEITKMERTKKQAQTQLRLLTEEVDVQKDYISRARAEMKNHICATGNDERQLFALKLQHNKECKGLIVQIQYLKAKFTRESLFRNDLGYQKQYLLVLLSQFEKGEQKVLAAIARIGYPISPKPRRVKKLKSVGYLIIFLARARRAKDAWQEQSASKKAVAAALEDVRRRRALPAS